MIEYTLLILGFQRLVVEIIVDLCAVGVRQVLNLDIYVIVICTFLNAECRLVVDVIVSVVVAIRLHIVCFGIISLRHTACIGIEFVLTFGQYYLIAFRILGLLTIRTERIVDGAVGYGRNQRHFLPHIVSTFL